MGDRAQLQITDGTRSFFLYTHWGGCELADTLARGLTSGRTLKGDTAYCLGKVLREMVRDTGGMDTDTGLGVGMAFKDNDDERGEPLVLDYKAGTVAFKGKTVTVDAFIAAPAESVGWA